MYLSSYTSKLLLVSLLLWTILICVLLRIKHGDKPKIKFIDWFFAGGVLYPVKPKNSVPLFYDQDQGDRIVEQLLYLPPNFNRSNFQKKTILSYIWIGNNDANSLFAKCPVSDCTVTRNGNEAASSDAIIYTDSSYAKINYKRSAEQIWIIYLLECPHHTSEMKSLNGLINWTATYRRDSDIVTPYEKWVYYDEEVIEKPQLINYAKDKVKKVAWFVSHCETPNNRLPYAKELQNYISIDIYGHCGQLSCPRQDANCFKLLRQYKFYLAFENSNCHDYITEKFFVNALSNDVVPIVMGPNKEDYIKVAPKNSFIHVNDFENPKALAEYLNYLDGDEKAYNSFFQWKGSGEFVNTYFWCRLCAMLHSPYPRKYYVDLESWWRGANVCTT